MRRVRSTIACSTDCAVASRLRFRVGFRGWRDASPGLIVVVACVTASPQPSGPVAEASEVAGLLASRRFIEEFQPVDSQQHRFAAPIDAAQGRSLAITDPVERIPRCIRSLKLCESILQADHTFQRLQELHRFAAKKLRALIVGQPVVLPAPGKMFRMGLFIAEAQVPRSLSPCALIQ